MEVQTQQRCQYLLPGDVREMTPGLFGFGGAIFDQKALTRALEEGEIRYAG